jgi:HMG (high mobility group) box
MDLASIFDEVIQKDHCAFDFECVNSVTSNAAAMTAFSAERSCGTVKRFPLSKSRSESIVSLEKPKRPLSAYNIFFQHEREKIITKDENVSLDDILGRIVCTDKPVKRRHRKSHGMIGFAELARTIAEKWKALDNSQKMIYEDKAAIEKSIYRAKVSEWEVTQDDNKNDDLYQAALEIAASSDGMDDDSHELSPIFPGYYGKGDCSPLTADTDSLSNLLMINHNQNESQRVIQHNSLNLQDYFLLTQRTLEMARASLTFPLFSNHRNQYGSNLSFLTSNDITTVDTMPMLPHHNNSASMQCFSANASIHPGYAMYVDPNLYSQNFDGQGNLKDNSM